ncbi:MAG TPA: hypothetical protein VH593_24975 [Ktedonobacteraceae bacterium]|jgi:hypothetical protein
MADSYLAISEIANDVNMQERMKAATTQQWHLGNVNLGDTTDSAYTVALWVTNNCYLWAASPGWGEKWTYAQDTHTDDPDYEPGKDEAVITDGDILATVQALGAE